MGQGKYLVITMKAAALALAAMISTFSSCASDVEYLAKQGGYLLRYSRGTLNAEALLEDSTTPEKTRDFLLLVKEIRHFAFDRVGLRDNGNYTRYKVVDRDYLVDVVSACDAVSFTPYMWSYPFLGRLPYKGFYERSDAEVEAARLKKEGYDVIARKVEAFSTLGFTRDPLYSFMTKYSPYKLSSLIIHEQTHATLFVKGQPDFNEELATFVGEKGASLWLAGKYGTGSPEYRAAVDEKADLDLFVSELKVLSGELKQVYASTLTRGDKLAEKARIIAGFKVRLTEEAGGFRTSEYRKLVGLPINNAYISLYDLYTDDLPLLRSFYERRCGSDLRTFMLEAEKLAKAGDVKKQMQAALSGVSAH
jgi:predicted aminopeptidase